MRSSSFGFVCLLLLGGTGLAQDAAPPQEVAPSGVRRALILCGLAGDAMHRKQFADSPASEAFEQIAGKVAEVAKR